MRSLSAPQPFRHPKGVALAGLNRHDLRLTTREGGAVAIDAAVADAWRAAASAAAHDADPLTLECLAEARLLEREPPVTAPQEDARAAAAPAAVVTAIVVVSSERERQWLGDCLASLAAQQPPLDEILVVDNASGAAIAGFATWPRCRVHALPRRQRLAAALNQAMAVAGRGDYFLMLNPDVKLDPLATHYMVTRAAASPRIAAVAPKTLFWRAPAFLNGIGNRVTGVGWGTDLYIGHLDLGQFDAVDDVVSASLTVNLMSRRALADVGGYDERFRSYYEDAEWAYRARMIGWTIGAAPLARAYHAFGGFWEPQGRGLSRAKLAAAVNGRLRLVMLLAEGGHMLDMLGCYRREDWANIRLALRQRDPAALAGYASGWAKTIVELPATRARRRQLRLRRAIADTVLFDDAKESPPVLMRGSMPVLTADVIDRVYRPLVHAGRTRLTTGT